MKITTVVVLLMTSALSQIAWGGDIPECHRNDAAAPTAITTVSKMTMPAPAMTGDQFALGLLKSIGPKLFVAPVVLAAERGMTSATASTCPRMQWDEWRRRNPKAQSRFAPNPDGRKTDPTEPNLLQPCGCSPAVALGMNGCGWWHMELGG